MLDSQRPILSELLKRNGNYLVLGNVYYAEKIFFVNSLIEWCLERKRNKSISNEQLKSYVMLLDRFLKDEIDLFWKNDTLYIKRYSEKQENESGDKNQSDGLESSN